jgi:hypothetical protein
VKQVLNDILD